MLLLAPLHARAACDGQPAREVMLRSLLRSLLLEGYAPAGSIVDSGANDGTESCLYAETSPSRTVHAVEPLLANYQQLQRCVPSHPNLKPLHAGLGAVASWVQAPRRGTQVVSSHMRRRASNRTSGPKFEVFRLDDLFGKAGPWREERLALAHLDVEGFEAQVLAGGRAIIARDQPLITTEVMVHTKPQETLALLRLLDEMGYDSFLVEEVCGNPADC